MSKQALLCQSGRKLVAFLQFALQITNQTGFWAKVTNIDQFTPAKKRCGMMVKVTNLLGTLYLFPLYYLTYFVLKGLISPGVSLTLI